MISQLQGSGRALAAVKGWTIYQTDIVQEFLYGKLEDVELYINPPARYPCHLAYLPKLLLAICDLHQGPVKFKQLVIDWLKANGYIAANDVQTIWCQ